MENRLDYKLYEWLIQWDTAGQERFKTITSAYYRGADAIIIVYDISDKNSFMHVKDWLDQVNKYSTDEPIKMILGNKIDLDNKKEVTQLDIDVIIYNIVYSESNRYSSY